MNFDARGADVNYLSFADELTKIAYRLQGKAEIQGLKLSIENRVGGVRSGIDPDGNKWRTKMKHAYGYILGSKGEDGEHLDAFIGPNKSSDVVTVIRIKDPKTGKTDEDKVFLGFSTKEDAIRSFRHHYDNPGKFFEKATVYTMDEFKERLKGPYKKKVKLSSIKTAKRKKPISTGLPKPGGQAVRMKGVGLGKDGNGYFVYTHRAGSKSYPSPEAIPDSVIKFIASTG